MFLLASDFDRTFYINNYDLRYEFYPTAGETVSFGLFYKDFKNPIEQTYHEAGSGVQYTYHNADRAVCYGIELDIKKNLSFRIGSFYFPSILNQELIFTNNIIIPLFQQSRHRGMPLIRLPTG